MSGMEAKTTKFSFRYCENSLSSTLFSFALVCLTVFLASCKGPIQEKKLTSELQMPRLVQDYQNLDHLTGAEFQLEPKNEQNGMTTHG